MDSKGKKKPPKEYLGPYVNDTFEIQQRITTSVYIRNSYDFTTTNHTVYAENTMGAAC